MLISQGVPLLGDGDGKTMLPVLVVNLCFYFFVFIPALVLPFYSINYVCMYVKTSYFRVSYALSTDTKIDDLG